MANYNPEHKAALDNLLLGNPLVRPGKMFGFPAYYVGKKLCISLYEDGVGVKLPAATAAHLLQTEPKMREWIQINLASSQDYRHYHSVFDESIRYLLAQQES